MSIDFTPILNRIYAKAALCRAFELECERRIKSNDVKCNVYLSTGQEYVAATLATWSEDTLPPTRRIFVQHRAHSVYLSFGGAMHRLILELLGDPKGCAGGMGGSNCLHSRTANIYGHDALVGTQVPIATGMAYANKKPTICFLGDAAVEEDYVLASWGWAATQRIPILYIVEDNNLSILTEKKVRRSWEARPVAQAFGLLAGESVDDPEVLYDAIPPLSLWPALLNVHTTRMRWHAGSGQDGDFFDRHKTVSTQVQNAAELDATAHRTVERAWLIAVGGAL